MILGCVAAATLLVLVMGLGIWRGVSTYYGKRIGDYVRHMVTANPE